MREMQEGNGFIIIIIIKKYNHAANLFRVPLFCRVRCHSQSLDL